MTINSKNQMDPTVEIRKLSPKYVRELVQILETHELWKRLMSIIPKKLERNNYICDITWENKHKYHSEHFKLIENASNKTKRACTEILLDEWGTSGRIRPALGHLLYLLKKAKLFRAADYVAITLLNQPMPERPSNGPEALITVHLPDSRYEPPKPNTNLEEIERIVTHRPVEDNPPVLIDRSHSNEAVRHNAPTVIPQIIISPDIEVEQAPGFPSPLVMQKEKSSTESISDETVSDMIKFSATIPVISQLLEDVDAAGDTNLPNFDLMNNSMSVSSSHSSREISSDTSENVSEKSVANPAFSQLLSNSMSSLPEVAEAWENPESHEPNIPNLSIMSNSIQDIADPPDLKLNFKQEHEIPMDESTNLPDFDALRSSNISIETPIVPSSTLLPNSSILNPNRTGSVNISTHSLHISTNHSQNSSDNSTKSRPCTSPLPNLSLNTLLPHYSYGDLELATNSFNENPYIAIEEDGRLLGKGAFGTVFLALGLLDRPVAIKKLFLEDVEVVNVDDTVTKQFRNEVEVLSKYQHKNLLSLLGYSCDGCTYCLIYEYIPGGALKDRLQVSENKLQWKERLSIALGTAEAVAYLHTAFSTPLIHRDIKSANILLDSKNKPKLCDFGLIKLLPNQNSNTATTVFGTSAYMPREAFAGEISVKLDTFSFGVVLLELLTSLPPMDENRKGVDLITHVGHICDNKDITPLLDKESGDWQEFNVNFAEELYKLALKCLKENRKRPEMVEVVAFLRELVGKL